VVSGRGETGIFLITYIFWMPKERREADVQAPRVLSSGILLGSEVFNIEGEKLGK
jgi:hypothetical protein